MSSCRFAVAVLERDEYLRAVGMHADQDEHAGFGSFRADVEVDAVGPHVYGFYWRLVQASAPAALVGTYETHTTRSHVPNPRQAAGPKSRRAPRRNPTGTPDGPLPERRRPGAPPCR